MTWTLLGIASWLGYGAGVLWLIITARRLSAARGALLSTFLTLLLLAGIVFVLLGTHG